MIRSFAAVCAALSLAACGTQEAGETPAADDPAPVLENPVAPGEDSAGGNAIPLALRGRWGLVPDDCTSTRGDAKGLIVIDARTIRFYESLATLETVREASETRLLGRFGFTGEGQQWAVDEELVLRSHDGTLVRTEHGEGAMAGPLVYAPCE